jgi:hypothetical protein
MAAPNLINVTTITGKTKAEWVPDTLTDILVNAVDSLQAHRINVLYVTNLSGSDSTTVTVDLYRSTISYKIASSIPVPMGNSLIVIAKDTSIYLEEGDTLRISSNQNNVLQYVLSYEIMS